MKRGAFCGALAASLFATLIAFSVESADLPRIGWLSPSSPSGMSRQLEAFRQGLRERGYVEGKTIAVEYRFGGEGTELIRELAVELVRLKVDVLVPVSPVAVQAAKKATNAIPIVAHDLGTDPVQAGFVASLSRPGGNLTGFFLDLPDLSGKQVELLKQTVPTLSRVAVLWDPAYSSFPRKATEAAARSLGIQPQILEARGPDDFGRAFDAAIEGHAQAFMVIARSSQTSPRRAGCRLFPLSGNLQTLAPSWHTVRTRSKRSGIWRIS